MAALLALASMVGIVRVAATIGLHISFDYNEGWNAYHAMEAMAGRSPYPPPSSLMSNNYPPISFYIVGALGRLLGDNIVAGRAVSLVAFLVTAWGIFEQSRVLGADFLGAAFGAAFYMTVTLFDYNYVGMNDPQLLGQAFGMWGLYFATIPRRVPLGAALLFALAFFTKDNLIVQPMAAVLWLSGVDRRAAIKLGGYGIAAGLAGFLAFNFTFGHSLFAVMDSPRVYSLTRAIARFVGFLETASVPIAATAFLFVCAPGERSLKFCTIYLALSVVAGFIFLGGAGTSGNVLFDAIIALALAAALGLGRRSPHIALHGVCFFAPALAIIIFHALTGSFYPRYWGDDAKLSATARAIAAIRAQPGPVACDTLALCYWAGKPAEIDFFAVRQAITTGAKSPSELANALAKRRYTLIAADMDKAFADSPTILQALHANYYAGSSPSLGVFWRKR
jgi:hypothetical protein